MAWLLLFAAGIAEIVMAMALKSAQGWTRFGPSVVGLGAALASVVLLTFAVTRLPVTTAYAVWTGFGAIGVSLIGIVLFGESTHPLRIACLAAIFAGMIGLHLIDAKA